MAKVARKQARFDKTNEGTPNVRLISVANARVTTSGGASAEAHGETIVVRDPVGKVVIDYDATTGTLRIGTGLEKLVLDAKEIELKAQVRASLVSPDLEITTTRASLHAEETTFVAETIHTVANELVEIVGRWEVRAERIMERAGEVYREAELVETKADRVRTLAKAAFDVIAGRATILADDDAVVDGKRVLLG